MHLHKEIDYEIFKFSRAWSQKLSITRLMSLLRLHKIQKNHLNFDRAQVISQRFSVIFLEE